MFVVFRHVPCTDTEDTADQRMMMIIVFILPFRQAVFDAEGVQTQTSMGPVQKTIIPNKKQT